MRVLVAYATKSGCTTDIAERVAEALSAHDLEAEAVAVESAGSASDYDAVVVGSGVRVGSWHAAAKDWVTANAEALGSMPVAFFTCGLTITDPDKAAEVRAYTDGLIEQTDVHPLDVGVFAGWNEPGKFGLLERTVLKALKAPVGDFRDFDAVARWADGVAAKLHAV